MQPRKQPARNKPNNGVVVQGSVSTSGGDFIGRDQINHYLVQVYALKADDATERYQKFSKGELQPYHPDQPFGVTTQSLFTGRESEIEDILAQVSNPKRRAVAIYGPSDVGKTSILAAGIIPPLVNAAALVIHLSDYSHPSAYIRAALLGQANQVKRALPKSSSLAKLMKTVVSATGQGVVLILDQFERFFLPDVSENERNELRTELSKVMELIEPRYLHLIIAARADLQRRLEREWGDLLPDLKQSPIHIEPLTREKAKRAIKHPSEVLKTIFYDEQVIDTYLLPDLDNLDNQETETILPADLQIVCARLYSLARESSVPLIDEKLYFQASNGKGAEQIIDLHFERLLSLVPEHHRELARLIAAAMLDPLQGFWTSPQQVLTPVVNPAEIDAAMSEMAEAKILIWHFSEGQKSYAFASNSIANAALRATGPEAIQRQQARNELEYAWRAWVAYDAWAGREQLQHIIQYPPIPPVRTEVALLLLRSAILRGQPTSVWLKMLASDRTIKLIKQMELNQITSDSAPALSKVNQVRQILGLADRELASLPNHSPSFGSLSWVGVMHPNPVCRQTAILALFVAFSETALDRLKGALATSEAPSKSSAELYGVLSDASPAIAESTRKLNPGLRLRIWNWRFWRRVRKDKTHVWALTFGGGLGAGLFLGLMRALLSPTLQLSAGQEFYIYFPTGVFIGVATVLGMLLGRLVYLPALEKGIEHFEKRSIPTMLLLGGFTFLLMHAILVGLIFLPALISSPLLMPLSFAAGLVLSMTIYDQPSLQKQEAKPDYWLRFGLAAVFFALIQLTFVLTQEISGGLHFVKFAVVYESRMIDVLNILGLQYILNIKHWPEIASMVDAALCGLVLSIGLNLGMAISNRWYQKWKTVLAQTS